MTIHYQSVQPYGLRAAYLTCIEGDDDTVDIVIRHALNIPTETPVIQSLDELRQPVDYWGAVIQAGKGRVYWTKQTPVYRTSYKALVRPDRSIAIGIHIDLPNLVNLHPFVDAILVPRLSLDGLVPITSTRDQIPKSLLKNMIVTFCILS